jgi:predicted dehydrogenase
METPLKKARIAVIGAGWWACQIYIPVALADAGIDLVAVNRRDAAALDRITAAFGVRGFTDFRAMLDEVRPDGVIIASPHTAHFDQAMAALQAGAHLLVDKPMTTSAADARRLMAEADRLGRQIVVPYGWNFKDMTRQAAALIAAGGVGEIRHVVCQMASATRDLFGGQGLVETEGHMFRPEPGTWADPARAGGYGWGQLSHALGVMFRITGLAPAEVFAMGGASPAGVDYYDALTVRMTNGATAAISGSATVPKQRGFQVDIRVFGTEGMLLYDIERARLEVIRDDGRDTVAQLAHDAGAYETAEPVAQLGAICRGERTDSDSPGLVGLRAVEVLDAMYRAMASRRVEGVA